jgi:tRNA-splicing ligase RtcB (3'-phosphate/5'-hydroxy nucleic acid ligase)
MFEVKGKYNTAKVYQDIEKVEESCLKQIEEISNSEAYRDCKVRVMADTHTGASSPIGFTVEYKGKVIPATVGVDIGCGMYLLKLEGIRKENIDFEAFDNFIRANIPSGMGVNSHKVIDFDLTRLKCYDHLINVDRLEATIPSLGGGNHFQELDEDSKGNIYFVVHTGSRNLGKQVAEYYQDLAYNLINLKTEEIKKEKMSLIKKYKEEGREKEIQSALTFLNEKYREEIAKESIPREYVYLEDSNLEDYLHDMKICQEFASLNRETICKMVAGFFNLNFEELEKFETIHNYIDVDNGILRKGAIAAYKDKKVLIPINMAEGSIIGVGRGCEDMNYSAPHGAGRLFSRTQAKSSLNVEEFKDKMKGIWSSCVNENTLDESPMAYKKLADIIPNIRDTIDVVEVIKPIYNFKAEE